MATKEKKKQSKTMPWIHGNKVNGKLNMNWKLPGRIQEFKNGKRTMDKPTRRWPARKEGTNFDQAKNQELPF